MGVLEQIMNVLKRIVHRSRERRAACESDAPLAIQRSDPGANVASPDRSG